MSNLDLICLDKEHESVVIDFLNLLTNVFEYLNGIILVEYHGIKRLLWVSKKYLEFWVVRCVSVFIKFVLNI